MNVTSAHREIRSESGEIKPNLHCIYTFPIDLTLSGIIPFGVQINH